MWKYFLVLMCLTNVACTSSCQNKSGGVDVPSEIATPVIIQKDQGINVGESEAIWATGIVKDAQGNPTILKISRIQLDPTQQYPKRVWDLKMEGTLASLKGTRTFVSEFGLLIGRSGSDGKVGLYLVRPDAAAPELIFSNVQGVGGGRATALAWLIKRNSKTYRFIGLAYNVNGTGTYRLERYIYDENTKGFNRVTPYEFTSFADGNSVYKGFVQPCSVFQDETCTPIFFGGGGGDSPNVFGIKLDSNVPATLCPRDTCTSTVAATVVQPPNKAFVSTSHPKTDAQPWGSINDKVYSFSGDPDTGDVFKSFDKTSAFDTFTSYDRVNQFIFRVTRKSSLQTDGTLCGSTGCAGSVVHVLHRSCFVDPTETNLSDGTVITQTSNPDCNPTDTSKQLSRIYSDAGLEAGPTSDLQNGCVAILSWKRPGEVDASGTYTAKVYKACLRDPANLDKGLSVLQIGEAEGFTYMYNDFTGATLSDRPAYVLFDYASRNVSNTKSASFYWVPKAGFSTTAVGINMGYRCFAKDSPPPEFKPITLGEAYKPTELPGCGGTGINQIELEIKVVPKTRFTRFQSISVTAIRN